MRSKYTKAILTILFLPGFVISYILYSILDIIINFKSVAFDQEYIMTHFLFKISLVIGFWFYVLTFLYYFGF